MDTLNYKCPNCSAGLTFDSKEQKMKCEFCGSTYSLEELDKLAEQQDTVEEDKTENGKGLNRNSGSQMRSQIWQCGTVRPVELKYWPKRQQDQRCVRIVTIQ